MSRPRGRSRVGTPDANAATAPQSLPKLSVTLVEFARPLLALLPEPPPIEKLRQVMRLTEIAWNVPVFEQRQSPLAAFLRTKLDAVRLQLLREMATALDAMMHSRRTKYVKDPRCAVIEVEDENGRARIAATARLGPPCPRCPDRPARFFGYRSFMVDALGAETTSKSIEPPNTGEAAAEADPKSRRRGGA